MQLPPQPEAGLEAGPPRWLPAFSGGFSESAGTEQLYGALQEQQLLARAAASRDLKHRYRINCVLLVLALLLPWGLFLVTFSAVSFYLHYAAPSTTMLSVVVGFVVSASNLVNVLRDRGASPKSRICPAYIGVASTLAVGLGWMLGDLNFWSCMHPGYEAEQLAKYGNVNPSSQQVRSGEIVPTQGKRYQDAGRIYFSHEAVVDINRSASFKMGDVYCVAPIVDPSCDRSCGYDFWAVGVNCCSEGADAFQCGAYNNPRAKSGIRMLTDSTRTFFRLAVLQAEGQHGLTSVHPLFFRWVQDPVAEINHWKKSGFRHFMVVMYISFFVSAAALAAVLKSTLRM